jgi:hypothetical protein
MSHYRLNSGRVWARRVASMMLLWLGLGAFIGVLSAPPNGGMIGFLAGALAGMIVLPAVGALFGLLGGRWREALVGAACGLVSGVAIGFFGGSSRLASSVNLYVLLGACAGATLPQLCRLQLWLVGMVLAQRQSLRTRVSGSSVASQEGVVNP